MSLAEDHSICVRAKQLPFTEQSFLAKMVTGTKWNKQTTFYLTNFYLQCSTRPGLHISGWLSVYSVLVFGGEETLERSERKTTFCMRSSDEEMPT